jgi:hypothetical protein
MILSAPANLHQTAVSGNHIAPLAVSPAIKLVMNFYFLNFST